MTDEQVPGSCADTGDAWKVSEGKLDEKKEAFQSEDL